MAEVPAAILKRCERGAAAMRQYEPIWQTCLAFFDNDQYVEMNAQTGNLERLETREGGSKPRHRLRLTRNRYTTGILAECAQLAARIPAYEATPMNADPLPSASGRLSEKVLLHLHDRIKLEIVAIDTLTASANTGCGFTWPHWKPDVGKVVAKEEDGREVKTGEIGIWVLGQDEVMWEPGVPFEDSSWLCVRKAQPVAELMKRPGYTGPKELKADAMTAPQEARFGGAQKDLVFVHHYLEKPSVGNDGGHWLTFAQKQLVAEPADYPDPDGKAVVHELPWIRRRHRHRAMGLGELALDIQRTFNRTVNQIVAWKNLVLNPQVLAPVGSIVTEMTDEPGAITEYRPIAGLKPEWRAVPDVPVGLFQMLDRCIQDFEEVFGQRSLGDTEGAAHVQALNERDMTRRGLVVKQTARWYGEQGMHLLRLVQRHYSEPRLLQIQGRFGVELIEGFLGTDLGDVAGVRVSPTSIEPRTRAAQEAKILSFAERGWVAPHQAMAALQGGQAEQLIDDYELDVARQNREIQRMMEVGSQQLEVDETLDPEEGAAQLAQQVQGVAPQAEDYDNHVVHIDVVSQWMKTKDFEEQSEMVRQTAREHLKGHQFFVQQEQMKEAMQQTVKAESLGQANAAADQDKQAPSEPGLDKQTEALA